MTAIIRYYHTPEHHYNTAIRWQHVAAEYAAKARASIEKRHYRAAANYQENAQYAAEVARMSLVALLRYEIGANT